MPGHRARQLGEVRPHLPGAQRAVEAHAERLGVLDRDVERLERLARQRAAAQVGDRDRDHQRQAPCRVSSKTSSIADQRRLGVERVDDAFRPAAGRSRRRSGRAPVPCRRPPSRRTCTARNAGLFDVRRDRQRLGRRADRAGDESRPVGRLRGPLVGDPARQLRAPRGSARSTRASRP